MNKRFAILARKAWNAMFLALYVVVRMQLWPLLGGIAEGRLAWIGGTDALSFSLWMGGGLFVFGFVSSS